MKVGDVTVTSHPVSSVEENVTRELIEAVCELEEWPRRSSTGMVVVPDAARRALEESAEVAVDLLAISDRASRSLASPSPCVAFVAESEKARDWLAESAGIIRPKVNRAVASGGGVSPIPEEVLAGLDDRLDGVTLLAEALSHQHPVGTYHEFIRLYERAFARPAPTLVPLLASFLDRQYGYTDQELRSWISLRGGATHADAKPRSKLVFAGDVTPIIDRMEQAAYDLLLNKATWHTPETARQERWRPHAGTASDKGDLFVIKGKGADLKFRIFDDFGVYPYDLSANIANLHERYWWGRGAEAP